MTPGNYKFSYRFKKNSTNPADDLAFFYTKDLNGERTVVLEQTGINTSKTITYTTPEFEITESGFYYMGFHGLRNPSYVKTWFLDFRMYRRGGAPEVPTFHKVTLNQTGDGIVYVKNGGNVVTLPADVEEGTELTVETYEMPGYKLTSLTAGGVDIMTAKKFTVNYDTEIVAVFSENKYVQEFGQGNGNGERNWENVVFTTVSDNSKTVNVNYTPNGTYDIYSDELVSEENKVSVYPDETFEMVINGNLNWIYTLAYIDWNGDGIFDEEPANLENLGFNPVIERDFATNANSRTYKITVPEDAKVGETRIRIAFGWKQTNLETIPSGEDVKNMNSTSIDEKKNAIVRDFLLNIKELDLPERTVTVQSSDEGMGTAVITGTEDQSITTNKLNVSVTAKPNAGYMFVNWTNADDNAEVSSENPYVYNGSAGITLVANFAVKDYPVMKRKFQTTNQQNRYLKEVVATVGETPQTIFTAASREDLPVTEYKTAETWTEDGALIDKTKTSIVLENGTTSFDMTFKAWTENLSINGETCKPEIVWTEQACYIDWNNDKDFDDQGEIYEAVGTAGNDNNFGDANGSLTEGWTRTFNVPAGIKAGTYRMRVVYAKGSGEDWANSFFVNGKGELTNGISYDFNVKVEEGEEPEYTVTWEGDTALGGSLKVVYASDESVEVINGVTGMPAGTELKVIVTANQGYKLKSLSYQLGETEPVAFETEPYTFKLTDNAVLAAVFEEKIPVLDWTVGGGRYGWGTTVITAGEQTAEVIERKDNGKWNVEKGTEVTVSTSIPEAGANQGVVAMVRVNKELVELDSEGKYTFVMEKDTELSVEYDIKKFNVTYNTTGEGTVVLKYGSGTFGDNKIIADTEFEVVATPASGWMKKSCEVTIGGVAQTGTVYKATGDIVITTVFEAQKYDLAVEQPENATITVRLQGKDEELVPGEDLLYHGDIIEITIELEEHYALNALRINGLTQGNEIKVYTYTVTDDLTISADVELERFALEFDDVEGVTFAVRAQGAGGVIKPGKSAVQYGQVLLIGVAVNEGYILKSVSVNGNVVDAVDGKYTHTVDGDVTITAVVEKDTSSIDRVENGTVYYNAADKILYTGNAESVKVYDLSGRLVLNAENCERVSLAGLADGIYTAVVDGKVVKLYR